MTNLLLSFLILSWQPHPLSIIILVIVITLFVMVLVFNRMIYHRIRKRMKDTALRGEQMEQALKTSGNNVVRYDQLDQYIYQLYGHLFPNGGISLDVWKEHLHPDDYEETLLRFRQMLTGAVERDDFFYRWNFNFSGGEPRWGYLHNASVVEYKPGTKRVQSIISTLHDETELRQQELQEQELTGKYRLIFEKSIVGQSFYSPDGRLLNANRKMREICHFDSDEGDAFFSKANLFDMPPFSEHVDRHNVQEFWVCALSIVPERNMHEYLEIHLHPIRNDQGKLIYISVAARNISEEREMYLKAKLNDIEIRKASESIRELEAELRYLMENCQMQAWRISLDRDCIEFFSGLTTVVRKFSLEDMLKIFVNQDDDFVQNLKKPEVSLAKPLFHICKMNPVVTQSSTEQQWVQINSIPEYDDKGRLIGCFGIWRNISHMMEKQEQLRHETQRANDSGRLKSVFLANMTHEIRTPLNAIVGFSDLLQAIESPEDKREMMRVIHNNCDMLLRLINDMLVLSNADANAMEIVSSDVDFASEFNQMCQSLAQRVQEPSVQFIKENPYSLLKVRLDIGRIQQVFTNFVTNSVKYTHQGHIKVGYRLEQRLVDGQQKEGIYGYCEDTGAGIPKDQCSRVFERFVKLNDFVQGTGLGLSICKAIIEKCDGVINVESELEKGSTFWFWIPIDVQSVQSVQSADAG